MVYGIAQIENTRYELRPSTVDSLAPWKFLGKILTRILYIICTVIDVLRVNNNILYIIILYDILGRLIKCNFKLNWEQTALRFT